jgi:hypothetical protein
MIAFITVVNEQSLRSDRLSIQAFAQCGESAICFEYWEAKLEQMTVRGTQRLETVTAEAKSPNNKHSNFRTLNLQERKAASSVCAFKAMQTTYIGVCGAKLLTQLTQSLRKTKHGLCNL